MSEQAVQVVEQAPTPEQHGDGAVVLGMIDRLLARPDVPVEKLEQLFALHQKVNADAARRAYDEAFPAMTAELPEIDKRGKIIIRDKNDRETIIQSTPYALWDDTNRMIKPIMAKHGFGLSFRISQTPDRITTTAVLSHRAGHREETAFSAPIDSTGSKNNVQGWGSSFSYGKRYTGTAILNITTRGEDDDGRAAGKLTGMITPEQVKEIKALLEATGEDIGALCQFHCVECLDDLTAKDYGIAKAKLTARKQFLAKKAGKP